MQRYQDKYAELLERKMQTIACDNIDASYDINANSITIMQFKFGIC